MFRRAGFDPRAALALRQVIRDRRAQVVVAHGGEPLKYAVAAAGTTPVAYYKIGLSSAEIERATRTWLYRALARRATRVVGVSPAILDQARDLLHVPQSKLSLIPNGRDPHTYHPPTDEEGRAHPPLVLFVGQLEAGKRPRMFLEMVEALRGRGVTFDAAMAGDGPLRRALEDPALALGVDLMGVRQDVPDLLRRTSVLVMTSEEATEGMPGVLIEAGLSGVPVVSTPAAGARDVISNGETGFVVDTDRAEDLAAKVEALLADPALRADLAQNARLRCETMFSLGTAAQLWRSLVSDLVSQPPCQ
jgi:glycosyltransferase involved in cell wall biosynthesis